MITGVGCKMMIFDDQRGHNSVVLCHNTPKIDDIISEILCGKVTDLVEPLVAPALMRIKILAYYI